MTEEEENNGRVTYTFPSNAPSGTKMGYKTNTSSSYTYITKTTKLVYDTSRNYDLIVELPSGWKFKKWNISDHCSYYGGKSETDNPTQVRYSGSYDNLVFSFEIEQDIIKREITHMITPGTTSAKLDSLKVYQSGVIDETFTYQSAPSGKKITGNQGETVVYTATPAAGEKFKHFVIPTVNPQREVIFTDNPLTTTYGILPTGGYVQGVNAVFEVDSPSTYNVTLKEDSTSTGVTIQYKIGTSAYKTITPGSSVTVESGTTITFKHGNLPTGYGLDYWNVGGQHITDQNPVSFTVTKNVNVSLHLKSTVEYKTLAIRFNSTASGNATIGYQINYPSGTKETTTTPITTQVESNKRVYFTVSNIATGYKFSEFTVTNSETGAIQHKTSSEFLLTMNANYTVQLVLVQSHYITVETTTGGIITPGSGYVDDGATPTYRISANQHYRISRVLVDGTSLGAITTYTFPAVHGPHTIRGEFSEMNKCVVRVSAGQGGTITPSGPTEYIYEDEQKTFTIKANTNYEIEDVLIDGVSHGAITSYTFSYSASGHTISATFKRGKQKFTITTQVIGEGTITPSATEVEEGSSVQIVSKPATDWVLKDVRDNGKSVGAISTYVIHNVRENHTVVAEFERTPYVKTVIYIKENGAWKVIDSEAYPQIYLKKDGVWFKLYSDEDAPMIYQKVGTKWVPLFKEVTTDLI